MKRYFLVILVYIVLPNCRTISTIKVLKNEPLIKLNYKVPQHGYFTFLVFVNKKEVKEVVYGYSIHIKEKKCWCSKRSEKIYNMNEYYNNKDSYGFKTAKEFIWSKQYYSCFADNFLEMTNQEKIYFFNKISEINNKQQNK